MLLLKNISKSFIQRGLVLENLSLDVSAGDTLAIMGPSGSGKTTLMNIMNYNDDESARYRSHNIGFVFQEHLLLPHLTVMENILLPLLAVKQSREESQLKQERATGLMKKTGISDLSSKYPGTISGGEAQRTALVRALVNNPSILLADEPTGSLDSDNAVIMGELLTEMNREYGITLILATHSDKLAKKMVRTLVFDHGKLR
jgi:lipoprotein-releasing system ATP-binding protein